MIVIRHKIFATLLSLLLATWGGNTRGAEHPLLGETLDGEYSLKAAFTLNFARLTHWPETSAKINFCIMGSSSMQNAFKDVDQKWIDDTPVHVKIINRDKDILNCQVLFISGISHSKIRKLYSYARNYPILTISEVADISRSGAIINFIRQDDKIRFQINLKYARQAGLKLSSRLLKLAIISE